MKSVTQHKSKENIIFVLSDEAAAKIKSLAEKQRKESFGMKIQVIPGGCAGYQYGMYFEKEPSKSDVVVESNGVRLFLDKNSVNFLKGTRLHYVDNLYGASFKFENPNVKESCHCGKSFG